MKNGWMSARNIKMQNYDCWDNTVAAYYSYNAANQQAGFFLIFLFLIRAISIKKILKSYVKVSRERSVI